jgi:hypothetical protein
VIKVFVGEDFAWETWAPEAAINDLWFGRFNDGDLVGLIPRDEFGACRMLDGEVAGFFLQLIGGFFSSASPFMGLGCDFLRDVFFGPNGKVLR